MSDADVLVVCGLARTEKNLIKGITEHQAKGILKLLFFKMEKIISCESYERSFHEFVLI